MSFRFVVVSDIHAHNWPQCSSVADDKLNTRLVDTMRALLRVKNYMLKHKIRTLVHTGDLFHVRGKPPVEAVGLLYVFFQKLKQTGMRVVLLAGNHDISTESDVTALVPFKDVAQVIQKPKRFVLDTYTNCVGIPYTNDSQKLREALKLVQRQTQLVFMHQGVHGVPVRSGYTPGEIMKKSWLPKRTVLNILGHYHEHQWINKNSLYVGSLTQQNWGDEGINKYFLDITIDGRKCKVLKRHTLAPQFVTLKPGVQSPGSFCRVILPQLQARKAEKIKEKMLRHGARWVEFEVVPHSVHEEVLKGRPKFGQAMIDKYVESCETELDKDQLKQAGGDILGQVSGA